ncbi:hypothetical protein L596_017915 [Steinernema carpocapsae]|uniref:Uncharacterized protein n=1 Tax=Steinernema carpocapsae TaxID=34508 RepID=A0A4U5N331_STECR|nr:hypothetical protein L596_017915 [Steinernema carpocapsae]
MAQFYNCIKESIQGALSLNSSLLMARFLLALPLLGLALLQISHLLTAALPLNLPIFCNFEFLRSVSMSHITLLALGTPRLPYPSSTATASILQFPTRLKSLVLGIATSPEPTLAKKSILCQSGQKNCLVYGSGNLYSSQVVTELDESATLNTQVPNTSFSTATLTDISTSTAVPNSAASCDISECASNETISAALFDPTIRVLTVVMIYNDADDKKALFENTKKTLYS